MTPRIRRASDHHHMPGVAEIAGQEDDEPDLGELGRLEDEQPGDPNAEVCAVDLIAHPGQTRHQQQPQRYSDDQVAILLELAVVAKDHDRRGEQDEAEHEPLRLLASKRLRDPVYDHDPETGQQRDEREQVGVGVRKRDAG